MLKVEYNIKNGACSPIPDGEHYIVIKQLKKLSTEQKLQFKNFIIQKQLKLTIDENFKQKIDDPDESKYIISELDILRQEQAKHIPKIKDMLTHFYAENIEHRRWGAPFPVIEIVKRGINKARGIEHVKQYLNVADEQVIAFGDEDNDIEMIKYASHGIAMNNGLQELKDVANDTTYSNNEDGIGRYLNEFFDLNIRYY